LASIVFTYFTLVLILLLNPQLPIHPWNFLLLYFSLYLYYGPLWIIFTGIAFALIQFFSEKKYPVGIIHPPTLTYFLSFTVFVLSVLLYLNYDYYLNIFEKAVKFTFIRVLFLNLLLAITGILFVFIRKIKKKWSQAAFYIVLSINIFNSFSSVITHMGDQRFPTGNPNKKPSIKFLTPAAEPRKIRIVLMEGLSLGLVNTLIAEQKLLNFNEILKQGASSRITTFQPNLDLSMLNTALTGLPPNSYYPHSQDKFKFFDLSYEFDILPRFIFFRQSPFLNTTSFYKRKDNGCLDDILLHYKSENRKALPFLYPPYIDQYSEKSLFRNNRFVLLFTDLVKPGDKKDKNYEIVKKCFFFDDFVKNTIPVLKDTDLYYLITRLPGLGIITKNFYQYYMPSLFGSTSRDNIKIKKYGKLVEKYYEYYDSIVGNLMSNTGDNELLVIMSFYEFEPLPVWRRILVRLFSEKDFYVYKSPASLGSIILYEKNAIKSGYPLKSISIYDIYPTLLYYAGFQLSPDMQGEVLKEIFTDQFLLNNPIDLDNIPNSLKK